MPDLFQFNNLCHTLDNKRIIRESAALKAAQILAIQGPSGSGKTTLLKMLARLLPSESGEVLLNGQNWNKYTPQEWRVKVHYQPQNPVLFAGSAAENLQLPFTLRQVQQSITFRLQDALTFLDHLGLSRSIMDQEARTLSGGEAARLALIRSLLIEPTILLLDEPTAHLDKDSAGQMLMLLHKWVTEAERAIIIVTHNAEDLEEFNDITLLDLHRRIQEDKHE